MATTTQTERIDLRLSPEMKERWERAAEIAGAPSVAGFVKMAVTERVEALLRDHDTLVLSAEDSAWLLEFLQTPAREPASSLQHAAQLHHELVRRD